MAYKKFDDPTDKVDASANKVYSIMDEKIRRALQGITNRVIGSTAGTGIVGPQFLAGIAVAGSAGFKTTYAVAVVRNGEWSTVAVQNNLFMPVGTQGTGTVAKYLVTSSDGTSATVRGPGNVVTRANYATEALAASAAKLPDLPDGDVALGYVSLVAGSTPLAFSLGAGFAVGTGGTCGTGTFTDLLCMPYNG
jgi:hypothetical protein